MQEAWYVCVRPSRLRYCSKFFADGHLDTFVTRLRYS